MDAVTLVLAVGLPFIGGNDKPAGPPCAWSAVWPQLNTKRYAMAPAGADVVPASDKAKIQRLPSDVKRKVKGDFKLDLVIDQTGQVRDAHIVQAPRVEPAWPEYEAHVLATAKTWKHTPDTVDGQPWPTCVTVTVKDN
jgi:hypothetical protein